MANPFIPYLVSEQEPGGWEDCVWATGVMFANFMAGENKYPATRKEYEGLRVAGGDGPAENPGDGSNYRNLRQGLLRRYGLGRLEGLSGVSDIPVGFGAGVQGLVGALPTRLKVTSFRGGHSVFVVRLSTSMFAWLDPLRPNGSPAVTASSKEINDYHRGLTGAEILLATPLKIGENMVPFKTPEVTTRVMLKEDPARPGNSVWIYTTDAFLRDGKQVSLEPMRWLRLVGETADWVAVAYEGLTPDANTTSTAMYVHPTGIAKRDVSVDTVTKVVQDPALIKERDTLKAENDNLKKALHADALLKAELLRLIGASV